MVPPEPAVGRYLRAIRRGTNPCRADSDAETQAANYRRGMERNALRTAQLVRILARFALSPALRLPYRNYCLHLDKLCRTCSGKTLKTRAALALDHWTAAGLNPTILRTIAEEVYGISSTR
uniref:Uncharacterized protein n=1 Tax=candidate division WOR-3 bacterium TaxID=2052148 RepID=A0A7C4C9Y1_UNCW3